MSGGDVAAAIGAGSSDNGGGGGEDSASSSSSCDGGAWRAIVSWERVDDGTPEVWCRPLLRMGRWGRGSEEWGGPGISRRRKSTHASQYHRDVPAAGSPHPHLFAYSASPNTRVWQPQVQADRGWLVDAKTSAEARSGRLAVLHERFPALVAQFDERCAHACLAALCACGIAALTRGVRVVLCQGTGMKWQAGEPQTVQT